MQVSTERLRFKILFGVRIRIWLRSELGSGLRLDIFVIVKVGVSDEGTLGVTAE